MPERPWERVNGQLYSKSICFHTEEIQLFPFKDVYLLMTPTHGEPWKDSLLMLLEQVIEFHPNRSFAVDFIEMALEIYIFNDDFDKAEQTLHELEQFGIETYDSVKYQSFKDRIMALRTKQ